MSFQICLEARLRPLSEWTIGNDCDSAKMLVKLGQISIAALGFTLLLLLCYVYIRVENVFKRYLKEQKAKRKLKEIEKEDSLSVWSFEEHS